MRFLTEAELEEIRATLIVGQHRGFGQHRISHATLAAMFAEIVRIREFAATGGYMDSAKWAKCASRPFNVPRTHSNPGDACPMGTQDGGATSMSLGAAVPPQEGG